MMAQIDEFVEKLITILLPFSVSSVSSVVKSSCDSRHMLP
jgi:hypothetical protein